MPGVFIDNQFSHGKNKRECIDPNSEQVIAVCNTGSNEDIDRAVQSSIVAFKNWSTHDNARERGACLLKFSQLVEQNRELLKNLIIQDNGKPTYEAGKFFFFKRRIIIFQK